MSFKLLNMYLEKLEIQGFKSFANSLTLRFNQELAAIVGPNGSGKSNIADAIRWVLGEQSLKLLRGKRGEDVIFSGSDKKTRLGLAEVSLYLNNEDHGAPLDYQQIAIGRRIYRSGDNEYFINNAKVRLIDIQLLLASANFGQKTYSVIGQGMIDFILTASAQERREFFDEATGIRQYQLKKEQAINKLINTRENLWQSKNILKEIEPRHRFLHRQIKKLEKRLDLENKLRQLQQLYFSKSLNDYFEELKIQTSELDKLNKQQQQAEQIINELKRKIANEHQGAGRQETFNNLQKQLADFQNDKNNLIKAKTVLEGKIDLDLIKNGQGQLVWLTNKKAELLKNEEELNEKINLLNKDYQLRELDLANKVKRLQKIIDQLKDLENELQIKVKNHDQGDPEELVKNFEELYKLEINFLANLNNLNTIEELNLLKKETEEIKDRLENFSKKIKNYLSKNPQVDLDLKKEIQELKSGHELLHKEIGQQKTALAIIEERINFSQENLKKIKTELTHLVSEEEDYHLINQKNGAKNSLKEKIKELESKIKERELMIGETAARIKDFNKSEDQKKSELFELQNKFQQEQQKLNIIVEKINLEKVGIAKIETRLEDLEKKISEEWPGHFEPSKEKIELDLAATGQEIERLKNQLNLIGGLDENINNEYEEVSSRYQFLKNEITDLEKALIDLEKVITELENKIKEIFNDNFERINNYFSEYFKILFSGGKAKLNFIKEKIETADEPAEAIAEADQENSAAGPPADEWLKKITKQKTGYQIEIQATPPGKRLSSINVLSGGEKALTSIALICAIIKNSPSPFVVLDEVDAALDEANSFRFARIIDELSKETQFICITHNRATIQKATILYGVTMGDDSVSKVLSLNLKEASQYIKDK